MTNQSLGDSCGCSVLGMISYDHQYLLKSIPSYIDLVDEVILGLDAERLTWGGHKFDLPQEFFHQLKTIDPQGKIKIIEERFCVPNFTTIQLDTRERNLLSERAKPGNWLVSVDSDEILLNPEVLISFLRGLQEQDLCVMASWIVVYKAIGDHALVVSSKLDGGLELFPVATRSRGQFVRARYTEQKRVVSPALALHYTWGRSSAEIGQKLQNWGHNSDFNVESYLALWEAVDLNNYRCLRDFHPLVPHEWPELVAVSLLNLERFDCSMLEPRALKEASSLKRFIKAFVAKNTSLRLRNPI